LSLFKIFRLEALEKTFPLERTLSASWARFSNQTIKIDLLIQALIIGSRPFDFCRQYAKFRDTYRSQVVNSALGAILQCQVD